MFFVSNYWRRLFLLTFPHPQQMNMPGSWFRKKSLSLGEKFEVLKENCNFGQNRWKSVYWRLIWLDTYVARKTAWYRSFVKNALEKSKFKHTNYFCQCRCEGVNASVMQYCCIALLDAMSMQDLHILICYLIANVHLILHCIAI